MFVETAYRVGMERAARGLMDASIMGDLFDFAFCCGREPTRASPVNVTDFEPDESP